MLKKNPFNSLFLRYDYYLYLIKMRKKFPLNVRMMTFVFYKIAFILVLNKD